MIYLNYGTGGYFTNEKYYKTNRNMCFQTAENMNLTNFTIECVIGNITDEGQNNYPISFGTYAIGMGISKYNASNKTVRTHGTGNTTNTFNLDGSKMFSLVMVKNNNLRTYYVNGVQMVQYSNSTALTIDNKLGLGNENLDSAVDTDDTVVMDIASVRVYDRALSLEEILQNYNVDNVRFNIDPSEQTTEVTIYENDKDIKLKYLESTGTQYIDTGYVPNNSTVIEINVRDSGNVIDYERFVGAVDAIDIMRNRTSNNFIFMINTALIYNNLIISTEDFTKLRFGNGQLIVNGQVISTYSNTFTTNKSLYLFYSNGADRYSSVQIQECKIYENDVLLHSYIPVLKDDTPCLYDEIEDSYLYNAGTGQFNYAIDESKLAAIINDISEEKEQKLIPGNIKKDIQILGVEGTYEGPGLDTSDATATANDILEGKTAYVDNEKITGSINLEYKNQKGYIENSNSNKSSVFNKANMGAILKEVAQFVTIENQNLNIYKLDNNEYILLKSISLNSIVDTLGGKATFVRSCCYDTTNNWYNLILTNANINKSSFTVLKYIPETEEVSLVSLYNNGYSNSDINSVVIPSPKYPDIFYTYVNNSKSGFVAFKINSNNTITYYKIPVNDSYNSASIASYGLSNNNNLILQRADGYYYFHVDPQNLSTSTIQNDTGYDICTCSLDESKCIAYKENKYYYCDLVIIDNSISISNLIELPTGFIPFTFTNMNNMFFSINTNSNTIGIIIFNDNIFEYYLIDNGDNFVDTSDINCLGLSFYADMSGISVYLNSTSCSNFNFVNSATILSSANIYNTKLVNTDGSNASANKILNGHLAFANGERVLGTMPNNGELNYTPSSQVQTIPAGYTSGGNVSGDSNLLPENIKSGITIFGITGTYTGKSSEVEEE